MSPMLTRADATPDSHSGPAARIEADVVEHAYAIAGGRRSRGWRRRDRPGRDRRADQVYPSGGRYRGTRRPAIEPAASRKRPGTAAGRGERSWPTRSERARWVARPGAGSCDEGVARPGRGSFTGFISLPQSSTNQDR
jgi:hypothetical protein